MWLLLPFLYSYFLRNGNFRSCRGPNCYTRPKLLIDVATAVNAAVVAVHHHHHTMRVVYMHGCWRITEEVNDVKAGLVYSLWTLLRNSKVQSYVEAWAL